MRLGSALSRSISTARVSNSDPELLIRAARGEKSEQQWLRNVDEQMTYLQRRFFSAW